MAHFKLVENLPREAADVLRAAGHDAVTIGEQAMNGDPDMAVSAVCRAEERALLTLDTDFADRRVYHPQDHPGLVVLRLRRQDRAHVVDVIRRLLPLFDTEPLAHSLWIVDEERVRIRRTDAAT